MKRWIRRLRRLVVVLAASALAMPAPLRADIIPSRVQSPRTAEAQRFAQRAVTAGLTQEEVHRTAAALSAEDLQFFADRPATVQVVSGLTPDQWIGAAALIVAIPAIVYIGGRAATIFGD